ncbi:P-loop containing nucleoside triphosphate hydrolase protein, partial [Kockovaella imperatae]
LFPVHTPCPVFAKVHPHNPVRLDLVLVQPIVTVESISDSAIFNVDDIEISTESLPSGPGQIFRQGERTFLNRKSGNDQLVKALLVEPVDQGIITSNTKIIITAEPLVDALGLDVNDNVSQSSHSRPSLNDFDPDAFLSSSLGLQLSSALDHNALDNEELAGSIDSSTSGTITPRRGSLRLPSPPVELDELELDREDDRYARFTAVRALGPSSSVDDLDNVDVCWMGLSGLGRSGIFEHDWVLIRPANASDGAQGQGRLVRAVAWEMLDEEQENLPSNPVLLPPAIYRALSPHPAESIHLEIVVIPTPFGVRSPTLPVAKTITIARIATAEGVDKRYERSWLRGLKNAFETASRCNSCRSDCKGRLVRRGDIISVPLWKDRTLESEESLSNEEQDLDMDAFETFTIPQPSAVGHFIVTGLSYEPLVPLEEDFAASTSSMARAGELGCWVDVGADGSTSMVLQGVEEARVCNRQADGSWLGISNTPKPFNPDISRRLRDLLSSAISSASRSIPLSLSVLVSGARGCGKTMLLSSIASALGYNIVMVDSFDLQGEASTRLEGTLMAALDKAGSCTPSILLVRHVDALAKKTEATAMGHQPPVVRILRVMSVKMQSLGKDTGYPCVLIATSTEADDIPGDLGSCFKQSFALEAPNAEQRFRIFAELLRGHRVADDVSLRDLAAQSASLLAGDIHALILRAQDLAIQRAEDATRRTNAELQQAGTSIHRTDFDRAVSEARSSYSDSIGAPKIPNVQWEDVGGLASIKKEILETVQLPLDHPELFAKGLKKRSGLLLYGPPGTGKTLLAKAVATTCNLNFFSVKGPELLNMYIGESEANVRRIFQKARDASPCIIFMDELDSIAPKRGNQGDSGGVMDRIVSQLLAELDGMSSGESGQVFVMGATNRPDLLDPALLRPGRFDRMLYLSLPTTHAAQSSILKALTRKFNLDPELDMDQVAEMCSFNYTGADFYALCSDAMLRAMTRTAANVDERIASFNTAGISPPNNAPRPLTVQFYLSNMASKAETTVEVTLNDFRVAMESLVPSVSDAEMEHYNRVQREFKGYALVQNGNAKDA